MAQLRDIKNRIESVTKTRKMTQAMKMVAAAKFKRSSERALQSRPYLAQLESMLAMIQDEIEGDIESPLMIPNGQQEKEAVILLTGDRGLCGGFNSSIIKSCSQFLKQHDKPVDLFLIGLKGFQHFKRSDYTIAHYYDGFWDGFDYDKVQDVVDDLITRYISGEYGKVWLFFNEFVTAVTSNQIQKQLLPLDLSTAQDKDTNTSVFLEPSPTAVVEKLSEDIIALTMFKATLESFAAEQGARMAAMDSATGNAGDMIQSLKLLYNRQRQAQITTELSEIVAGAEALSA